MLRAIPLIFIQIMSPMISAAENSNLSIQSILGIYSVIEKEADPRVGGVAEIISTEAGVGYRLSPIKNASFPLLEKKVVSDSANTVFSNLDDKTLLQEGVFADGTLQIRYQQFDGYLEVTSEKCIGSNCEKENFVLTMGKAKGEELLADDFFKQFSGAYAILTAGGVPPHGAGSRGFISVEDGEGIITMPFCLENGSCLPGDQFFSLKESKVFLLTHPDFKAYQLLIKDENEKTQHFTWIETNSNFQFYNFQFELPSKEKITLEHVLSKNSCY